MVARLALDAMVWTGEGSPTLEQRRKKLPEFQSMNRRPIDKAFIHSIFDRDHPGTAEEKVIEAFADAVCALDNSVPTGTYVDMCSRLPVVDPEKITVPTLIMRGQWDGIASIEDLLKFFDEAAEPGQAVHRNVPAFHTRASSRRTTCWSTTSSRVCSRSRRRCIAASRRIENGRIVRPFAFKRQVSRRDRQVFARNVDFHRRRGSPVSVHIRLERAIWPVRRPHLRGRGQGRAYARRPSCSRSGGEIERLAGSKIDTRLRLVVAGDFRAEDRVPRKVVAAREVDHQRDVAVRHGRSLKRRLSRASAAGTSGHASSRCQARLSSRSAVVGQIA